MIDPTRLAPSPEDEIGRAAALDYLLGRIDYERAPNHPYGERTFKLDRVRTLLNRLGSPDAGLPIVHIAGTKGKGSTSAQVASVLHAAGYDVGVFSSPHLDRIEERFCINGVPCDSATFVSLVDRIRPLVAQLDEEADRQGDADVRLTFFELTTAAALLLFADRKVDVAVLEVGLGGRLDATNVCQSTVSAITSISLDHTRQLGSTCEAIAREKAGIIKPGIPVVVGPMDAGPLGEIAAIARQRGARTVLCDADYRFTYRPPRRSEVGALGSLDYELRPSPGGGADEALVLTDVPLGLPGAHQAANAAVALTILAELRRQGWLVSTAAIRQGLSAARLPGRVEIVAGDPCVVLDVAHNVASAAALVRTLEEQFSGTQRRLLLSISRDKDAEGIVRTLLPHFDSVAVTAFQENPRALPIPRLARICEQTLADLGRPRDQLSVCATPAAAWQRLQAECRLGDVLCVTGSFFIVAEIRARLARERRDV